MGDRTPEPRAGAADGPPVNRARRRLLGAGALSSLLPHAGTATAAEGRAVLRDGSGRVDWGAVRREFRLDPAYVHLAGLLLASHPASVHRAIERHREGLDDNPALYLDERRWNYERAARRTAADFLGVRFEDVALCPNTTSGLGLLYGGLRVRRGQELLTTRFDYYATIKALEYKARSSGARLRRIALSESVRHIGADEIVGRLLEGVGARSRVLGLTWVHSSTGLKLPLARIAAALAEHNAERDPEDRLLLCADGVHGLGVEDFDLPRLGCDFFVAGTHKWLFGPRGTALLWGRPEVQDALQAIIPTFTPDGTFGGRLTPGGFKAFEHVFAVPHAFVLHERIGRQNIQARVRELCHQLKRGLAGMGHVTLHTPMDPELSSGIVCFDIDGMTPAEVVARLRARRIVASATPYAPSHARLTPAIYNTPEEIETALAAIRSLR